ncbi:GntR family transcriptional regulator [Sciscionella marina]|uniref:GntR family transcriptional regulator n=1 Tax=Sciscionella marina TaxID=508770 RepID=UPI001969B2A8|nr:GntR family transcriptional regulator [Sciscionella marina]
MARRKASVPGEPNGPVATAAGSRPPTSRADYVHTVLHKEILDGTLQPGTPVLQDEIAGRLGVSITPVREALRRLESTGLVTYQAHYGATVTELSPAALTELYQLRAAIEGLAANLAANHITEDDLAELRAIHAEMQSAQQAHDTTALAEGSRRFHATIAHIGGPALLSRHLAGLWDSYPVPHTASVWQFADVAARCVAEHGKLIGALENGDGVTAQRLMEDHITGVPEDREAHELDGPPC